MILNIETSHLYCSVSLSNGDNLVDFILSEKQNNHSEDLAVFVEQLIKRNSLKINDLKAVSVSKGPGSYTGLRIGVAVAKGICYQNNIPLIGIDSLDIMARFGFEKYIEIDRNNIVCPVLGFRNDEFVTAFYKSNFEKVLDTTIVVPSIEFFEPFLQKYQVAIVGFDVKKIQEKIDDYRIVYIENVYPTAEYMPVLANKKYKNKYFENIAYFEPNYLREFQPSKTKNKLW